MHHFTGWAFLGDDLPTNPDQPGQVAGQKGITAGQCSYLCSTTPACVMFFHGSMNTCTNCCWMKGKFNMATQTMSLTGMTTYIGKLLVLDGAIPLVSGPTLMLPRHMSSELMPLNKCQSGGKSCQQGYAARAGAYIRVIAGGVEHWVSTTALTWSAAQAACKADLGLSLATVGSAQQASSLHSKFKSDFFTEDYW